MPRGHPLDLDNIHAVLWERVDRLGRTRLNQAELALALGITKYTMSRAIAVMVEEKRIRLVTHTRQNSGVFVVEDPNVWTRD